MKLLTKTAAVGLVISVAACAKAPESITASYVSEVPYHSYTCEQLGQESARLSEAYAVTAKAQEDARAGDAWGVFLLGAPTSTLSGGNVAHEIASLKGQQNAVRKVMIAKGC